MATQSPTVLLDHYLKQLKLPTMLREYHSVAGVSAREGQVAYLLRLSERELIEREQRAAQRRIKAAQSRRKTLDTFHSSSTLHQSSSGPGTHAGEYLETHECILFMGNPGTGKTHLAPSVMRPVLKASGYGSFPSPPWSLNYLKPERTVSSNVS